MQLDKHIRESLFKPFPEELTKFVHYNRLIGLWYRIYNRLPIRPHIELLLAIDNQDQAAFQLHYKANTHSPIIINTIKDAETVFALSAKINSECLGNHCSKFVNLADFATEKVRVAQLGFFIMPYAIVEMTIDEQLKAISELPRHMLCSLDISSESPLAHLREPILSRFSRL